MLTFEGDRVFPVPPAELWPKLSDASFLVYCVPDGTVKGTPERSKAACLVRPGFAFVRGSMDVTVDIVEAVAPTHVKMQLTSKGIGTSSDVVVSMTIAAEGSGSKIHYYAEITRLGGLLRAVPGGLIRGSAQKVIEDVWKNVEKKLTPS